MVHTINSGSTSTHRESGNGTSALVRPHPVGLLHVWNQFIEEVVFKLPMRRIEVYHVVLVCLRTDYHHLPYRSVADKAVGKLAQIAALLPHRVRLTSSVHQIEHRISPERVLVISSRQIDRIFAFRHSLKQFARHSLLLHPTRTTLRSNRLGMQTQHAHTKQDTHNSPTLNVPKQNIQYIHIRIIFWLYISKVSHFGC